MKKPYSAWDFVVAYIDRMMLLRFFKTFWRIGITPLAFWYFWDSGNNFLDMLVSLHSMWGNIAHVTCGIGLLVIMACELILTLMYLTTKSEDYKDSIPWPINGPIFFLILVSMLLYSIFWVFPKYPFGLFRNDVEKFQLEYETEHYMAEEIEAMKVADDLLLHSKPKTPKKMAKVIREM